MKKILLLLAFVPFLMNAQVWSDNFDDEDLSDWTILDEDGDGNSWGDQFTVNNGDGVPVTPVSLISRSWMGSPLTPDNWIISPAIDLSGISGTVTLNYVTQVAAASWDEEVYSIHVATSSDLVSLLISPVSLTETLGDAGDTGTPVSHSFDISAMAGEAVVYIAFRHHDVTDMDYISIDDVEVMAPTASLVDLQDFGFEYFPNPVTNVLNLKANTAIENVSIVNLLGQEVMRVAPNALRTSIDTSDLNVGVYLVDVKIGNTNGTIKIVKE